jgi:hypothetical protein
MTSFVWDKSEIDKFISLMYVDGDTTYLHIQQRKKYGAKKDMIINRKSVRSVSAITDRIVSMDTTYVNDETKILVPIDQCVFYMSIEPCDVKKAQKAASLSIVNRIFNDESFSFTSIYYSELQRTISSRRWIDIDVDVKSEKLLNDILSEVPSYHIVIETQGGYHVILPSKDQTSTSMRNIYEKFVKCNKEVEIKKRSLCPVPGTIQKGFKVKIIRQSS